METTPKWIPLLFGCILLFVGALILGALIGIVPTNEDGQFLVPSLIILCLGLGLVFGGLLLWLPY